MVAVGRQLISPHYIGVAIVDGGQRASQVTCIVGVNLFAQQIPAIVIAVDGGGIGVLIILPHQLIQTVVVVIPMLLRFPVVDMGNVPVGVVKIAEFNSKA